MRVSPSSSRGMRWGDSDFFFSLRGEAMVNDDDQDVWGMNLMGEMWK